MTVGSGSDSVGGGGGGGPTENLFLIKDLFHVSFAMSLVLRTIKVISVFIPWASTLTSNPPIMCQMGYHSVHERGNVMIML